MSGGRENQNNPSFEDVIQTLFRRFSCEEIQTVHPGRIVEYNPKTQEADVELNVIRNYVNGKPLKLPIVASVPVIHPRTTTSMIKLPVSIGDSVLLMFSKSSLDSFLATGSSAVYSSGSQFLLKDAIAIPGLFPFSQPNNSGAPDDLEIINKTQKIVIKASGDIELGTTGLKKLITETAQDIINDHGHDYIVQGAPFITGTPVKGIAPTTVPTPIPDTALTLRTKAE